MQVAKAEILRLVDYHGVGVGYVQTVLYEGGAQHHVVVSPHEVQHYVLQLPGLHLPVGDAYLHVRYKPVQYLVYGIQLLDPVVKEEELPATVELIVYYALYLLFIEKDYLGLHRNAVGRGSVYYAEVAGAKQGELQGPGYGGRGKGEGVHRGLELP